jgi:hypothetical protein
VVHVYQTPTILIVNRRGVVSTLTGLTDTFALKQTGWRLCGLRRRA